MAIVASTTILNGKYKIIREIGQGGMGRVWLAEELVFGSRPVALKEPRTDLPPAELDEVKQRYAQEVQINLALQKVEAPNVVPVYTVEPFDGSSLLSMAFMPNGDLVQLLAQSGGRLPVDRALEITTAILQALRAAHEHPLEIVHRDVKPSNILFDGNNRPYLADFGLAQLSGTSSRSQGQAARPHPGTPAYMAPEQASSTAYLTPAADVYAVGCVLFEMLTGSKYKRVRPGTTAGSLRPETPAWVDAVLAKTTAEDPFDRYSSAADMLTELSAGKPPAGAGPDRSPIPNVRGAGAPKAESMVAVAAADKVHTASGRSAVRRSLYAAAVILLALAAAGAAYYVTQRLGSTSGVKTGAAALAMSGGQGAVPPTDTAAAHALANPELAAGGSASAAAAVITSTAPSTPAVTVPSVDSDPTPVSVSPIDTTVPPRNTRVTPTRAPGRVSTPVLTVTPVPTTPVPVRPPSVSEQPLVTTNDIINVRGGPGTNYRLVGSAQVGETFFVLGRSPAGDWWQVDFHGQPGWLFGQLVTATGTEGVAVAQNIPSPPTAAPVPPTNTPAAQSTATSMAGAAQAPAPSNSNANSGNFPYSLGSTERCDPNPGTTYFSGFVRDANNNPLNAVCIHIDFYGPRNTKCSGCDGVGDGNWGFSPFSGPAKPGTTVSIFVVPCSPNLPPGGQTENTGFGDLTPQSPAWTHTINQSEQCTGIAFYKK